MTAPEHTHLKTNTIEQQQSQKLADKEKKTVK